MAKLKLGSTSRPVYLNGSLVTVVEKYTGTGETVLSQTFGSGTADEYTFSWTLNGVAQSGTFRDGSPWVVPSKGSSITLVSATPSNQTETVNNITFADGNTGSLTIRHSGIIVNPTGGPSRTVAQMAAGVSSYSGQWRLGDNRIGNVSVNAATAQAQCDGYFDTVGFASVQSAMAGAGLGLNVGDVCVLTNSLFDNSDTQYSGSSSIGCTGTSGNGTNWGVLTGIRWQAALYVLSSPPASPSTTFRPPVVWNTSEHGTRPIYTESDVVDLSALLHSSNVNSPTTLVAYGYSGASLSGTDYCVGPIIADRSGVSYLSQTAAFNFVIGNKSTYGGDIATSMGNLLAKSFAGASIDTDRLYAYLQLCLDYYGQLTERSMQSSGAGQKAGQGLPHILFMSKAFGLTSAYGVDEMLDDMFDASYASSTGDSSYASLTATEKLSVRRALYYEEQVCRPIEASGSGDFSYDSIGSSYRATIDPAIDIQDFDSAVRQQLIEQDRSDNWVLTPDTNWALSTDASTQEGEYFFLAYQNNSLETINGFGHIELISRPSGLWTGASDGKADQYFNLLGCTLSIDGSEYYIMAVSENVENGYTVSSSSPIHLLLDRPLESDPSLASSISIYPFRSTDVGKYYFHREAALQPQWSSPCMQNDGYAKFLFRSGSVQYSALRILDGNADKLGSFGQLLVDHYWTASSDHQWQFGHDAGPRNLFSFLFGPVHAPGQWTLSITGQASNVICRDVEALKQQA
jgi:hypothetical protein